MTVWGRGYYLKDIADSLKITYITVVLWSTDSLNSDFPRIMKMAQTLPQIPNYTFIFIKKYFLEMRKSSYLNLIISVLPSYCLLDLGPSKFKIVLNLLKF